MAREYAKKFYRSKAWQQCRASYITKVYGLCERCKEPGKILHHKKYITPDNINDPDITLNHDNLEFVCATCHQWEHFEKYSSVRYGLEFDAEGNLIQK